VRHQDVLRLGAAPAGPDLGLRFGLGLGLGFRPAPAARGEQRRCSQGEDRQGRV